ncbi:MAG: putative nADH dehydrogenase subunit 2 [Bacillales bacterium]|jgi:hypothetical protein|nr:putative nADH dehydrogenase subunit 2 [Bacillales bacterium]
MINKLEKDYISASGSFKQKSKEDAVKVVDKVLVEMINEWNSKRQFTTFEEDEEMLEKIDALRDVLYYLTNKDMYNNNPKIREQFHIGYKEYLEFGDIGENELELDKKVKMALVKLTHRKNGLDNFYGVSLKNLHIYFVEQERINNYKNLLKKCEEQYGEQTAKIMLDIAVESGEQVLNYLELKDKYCSHVALKMITNKIDEIEALSIYRANYKKLYLRGIIGA